MTCCSFSLLGIFSLNVHQIFGEQCVYEGNNKATFVPIHCRHNENLLLGNLYIWGLDSLHKGNRQLKNKNRNRSFILISGCNIFMKCIVYS